MVLLIARNQLPTSATHTPEQWRPQCTCSRSCKSRWIIPAETNPRLQSIQKKLQKH